MWFPKKDKEVYRFPDSVQRSIPIRAWQPNGIFVHGRVGRDNGLFSASWRFTDIEYTAIDMEAQKGVIMQYEDVIKSIDTDCLTKITIINRKADADEFRMALQIPEREDGLEIYRGEINKANMERASVGSNRILQDKYITVSAPRRTVEEAKILFNRTEGNLRSYFEALGSRCTRLSTRDRFRVLYDFFKPGQSSSFKLDLEQERKAAQDVKDYIIPVSMEFSPKEDYFKLDGRYGRALFVQSLPSLLADTFIADLVELPREMVLSIDMVSKSKEEALNYIRRKLLAVNAERINVVSKANKMGHFNAEAPYELEERKRELEELLDEINNEDRRIVLTQVTLVHMADSLEELDSDTAQMLSVGRTHDCQIAPLRLQQEVGLNTALPYGLRQTDTLRTLTSVVAAGLMPFNTQEIWDKNGICYGVNQISGNLVVSDRGELQNGNGMIFGTSGSGKSTTAKLEFISAFLKYVNDDFIVIDPQSEYIRLMRLFGGTVVDISSGSRDHINVMDTYSSFEGKDDPVAIKAEFILSLAEQFMDKVKSGQRSIINRCTRQLLMQRDKSSVCTLVDLYDLLLKQKEPEARDIALSFEIFVEGTLNTFAHETNVDMSNRLVCFDIKDLSDNMKPIGMLVVMDAILSRVARNKALGKRTWVYFDEFWMMYRSEYTAKLMDSFWKLVRKYGGFMTGITQNVTETLESPFARNMLANSEFVIMMNQAGPDRAILAEVLKLSPSQMAYITNAPQGCGLMRRGSAVVPFDGVFDKEQKTRLYRAITTKLEEVKAFEREDISEQSGQS